MTERELDDLAAQIHFAEKPPTRLPILTPERQALIEAQKALTCAKRKIDEVLGRGE